jgi:hypothetical protein
VGGRGLWPAGGSGGRVTPHGALAGIAPWLGLCGFYWLRGEWPAFWFWGWQSLRRMSLVSPSSVENAIFTLLTALFWLPL